MAKRTIARKGAAPRKNYKPWKGAMRPHFNTSMTKSLNAVSKMPYVEMTCNLLVSIVSTNTPAGSVDQMSFARMAYVA